VRFVVEKVAVGQVFLQVLHLSCNYHAIAVLYSLMCHLVAGQWPVSGHSSIETSSPPFATVTTITDLIKSFKRLRGRFGLWSSGLCCCVVLYKS
jgi:hypothetical protein